MIFQTSPLRAAFVLLLPCLLQAQTLTWDANLNVEDVQNGSGDWNLTNTNWWNGSTNVSWTNGVNAIAQFGIPTPVSANSVTIKTDLQLKELRFLTVTAGTIASGQQYTLNGDVARVIDFGTNGLIQMEDRSSGGSQFVSLGANLTLKGENLRIQKYGDGKAFQYLTLGMAANPDLTGTFTIGGSIYVTVNRPATLGSVDRIVVEDGGSAALGTASAVYDKPFEIAGIGKGLDEAGTSGYGAIRFTSNGTQLTGPVTLTANAAVQTNTSGSNNVSDIVISGGISDNGNGYSFQRYAYGRGNGTLTLTGVNTYGGATVLGRDASGNSGGITLLDFTRVMAPQDDILYHGLETAGALEMIGGNSGAVLRLIGREGQEHHQRFGELKVNGTYNEVVLQAGAGGGMNMSVGTIERLGTSVLTVYGPVTGAFTTQQADGFVGPWLSYQSATGTRSWAKIENGVLMDGFIGEVIHEGGSLLSDGLYAGQHVALTSASEGDVLLGAGTTDILTLSMADDRFARQVVIGAANTLRLGAVGGVQLVAGARDLTVGMEGTGAKLTAGGAPTTPGQVHLTNHSDRAVLTIHASIVNNGSGGTVSVLVNGAPGSRTVLNAANTHTGGTIVASGILEVRNNGALGTSGTVRVVDGATLGLSGDVTLSRALAAVSGFGDNGKGAIRSLSGVNTVAAQITQIAPTLITADAGSVLRLQRSLATENSITGSYALTFGGEGTIEVNSRISTSSTALTKTGNGLLILAGDNSLTGSIVIEQGVLRVLHSNGLGSSGTSFGTTTVSAAGVLEIGGGIELLAEPISLNSAGINNGGGIVNIGGNNRITGTITIGATTTRIHSDDGLLTLGGSTGNAVAHTSTSARTLVFGGSGDIEVVRPMARTAASPGAFTVTKEGAGNLTLATTVGNSATIVTTGTMKLDFSGSNSPVNNILGSTATLNMNGGRLELIGSQGASHSQTLSTLTVGGSYSEIVFEPNGASSLKLTVGEIGRTVGGLLVIDPNQTGSMFTVGVTGIANNQALMNDGRMFVVVRDPVGGDDWAGTSVLTGGVREIVKLSQLGIQTSSTADSLVGHADIAEGVTLTTLNADTAINSLRFAVPQATTIARPDGEERVLSTGGILVSSTVGAHDSIIDVSLRPTAVTGGSNPDLVIMQNNTQGDLILKGGVLNLVDETRTIVTVVKAGPGRLVMSGKNTFSGSLRVYEGEVQFLNGVEVASGMEFLLGSGTSSGRVVLGSAAGTASLLIDYINVVGVGTDNRIVGGASTVSRLTLSGATASNFQTGFIGGDGPNENNLEFRLSNQSAVVRLGPANTYAGLTIVSRGTLELSRLANIGEPSSLGTGLQNGLIQLADATTSALNSVAKAVLRYVGTEDSVTNRVIRITNSDDPGDIIEVRAVLENNGTGTLQFTSAFTVAGSNNRGRILELSGSNDGFNSVVGVGEVSVSNRTTLIKSGAGTWAVTGGNTFTGGTQVLEGRLLVTNSSGSATGLGEVTVSAGAVLGGAGRIAPDADKGIVLDGAVLQVGTDLAGRQGAAGTLTLQTSGSGAIELLNGSVMEFDLWAGAGMGDVSSEAGMADLLVVGGRLVLGEGSVLKVGDPTWMQGWGSGDTWQLFDWTTLSAEVEGEFWSYDLPVLPVGLNWDVSKLMVNGTISVVPEPGRIFLVGLGLISVLLRRKRSSRGATF
jgi:fibronectin-binding autotransporter adhesin